MVQLKFTDVGKLPPPVLQFADVTFGYSRDRVLYRDVRLAPRVSDTTSACALPSGCVTMGCTACQALLHAGLKQGCMHKLLTS